MAPNGTTKMSPTQAVEHLEAEHEILKHAHDGMRAVLKLFGKSSGEVRKAAWRALLETRKAFAIQQENEERIFDTVSRFEAQGDLFAPAPEPKPSSEGDPPAIVAMSPASPESKPKASRSRSRSPRPQVTH